MGGERRLSWQVVTTLTGLVNRRGFEQRLEQAVISAKTSNHQHALCYLDIDQFKIVNDTCGHLAGDECYISQHLRISNYAKLIFGAFRWR